MLRGCGLRRRFCSAFRGFCRFCGCLDQIGVVYAVVVVVMVVTFQGLLSGSLSSAVEVEAVVARTAHLQD